MPPKRKTPAEPDPPAPPPKQRGPHAWRGSIRDFEIAGEVVLPGETRDLRLPVSESYLGAAVSTPIRVMRAKRPGPAVVLTGAIHGDEMTGIGIVRELHYGRPPQLVAGTLVCVPAVNILGLQNNERYMPDRRDLNRSFPGQPNGSMTGRLAHALFEGVVRKCDFGIDFHSAAIQRTNYPNVRGDLRDPWVRRMARAFGCELIVDGKGPDGSLRREACNAGVPTIILEAGEVWKIEPRVVDIGIRGCMNVLAMLGMVDGKVEEPLFQLMIKKSTWVRARRGGFIGFDARPGDFVHPGQVIAANYNIFGVEGNELVAESHGVVLGMATMPAVQPGEPVYHIAEVSEASWRRARKLLARSGDSHSYNRIREDLSTSVTTTGRDNGG